MDKKDIKYWEKRKAQRMFEHMQSAEEIADQITKAYWKASGYLNHQLDEIYNRYKVKHHLTDAEAKRFLNRMHDRSSFDELKNLLKQETDSNEKKELLKLIESPAYSARIQRLQDLQQEIDELMNSVYKLEKERSTRYYTNLANDTYYKSIFDTQRETGLAFSFSKIPSKQIDKVLKSKWSGINYSQRIWNNTQKLAEDLKEELLINLLTGRTDREVAEIISNKFGSGAMEARRLVRTESCYIVNEMEGQSYEECDIEKYMFIATLDKRTSKVCQEHDHKVYLVKDRQPGKNCPPMHPWCRSTTIAYLDDDTLAGMERRARDPDTGKTYTVPGNTSYREWHEKYVDGKIQSAAEKVAISKSKLLYESKFYYDNKDEIKNMLNEFMNEYSNKRNEYSMLISPNNKVYLIKGDRISVDYAMLSDEVFKDSIVIHNHPNDKTHYSFSAADVNFFLSNSIFESYAFDDIYKYSMKSNKKHKKVHITNSEFNEIFYEILTERDFVEIPEEDEYHEVVKRLSKKYNFEYERKKRI